MPYTYRLFPHTLKFSFPAGTSRGVLHEHQVYYLFVKNEETQQVGLGEIAPLKGLSPDYGVNIAEEVEAIFKVLNASTESLETVGQVLEFVSQDLPSVRFGFESAFRALWQGDLHTYFPGKFAQGEEKLPINGLIWMGDTGFMREQMKQKLAAGFTCLKMKIGAIDFDKEIAILEEIRRLAPPEKLILRVDANGAFSPEEALQKLEILSRFALHSIEQPIQPKQWEVMAELCKKSPVPIALDEELIGVTRAEEQAALIEKIQPAYVIFKPTLLGGFENTKKWIDLAKKNAIGWWVTSALESNVGLSAICQFTATHATDKTMHQGLGTGQLYTNNWESPLEVSAGHIQSVSSKGWGKLFEG